MKPIYTARIALKDTPARYCKAEGFESLKQVVGLVNCSERSLRGWFTSNRARFERALVLARFTMASNFKRVKICL